MSERSSLGKILEVVEVFEIVFGKTPGKYVTKYFEKISDRHIED